LRAARRIDLLRRHQEHQSGRPGYQSARYADLSRGRLCGSAPPLQLERDRPPRCVSAAGTVLEETEFEMRPDDPLSARTSEPGKGAASAAPFFWRRPCGGSKVGR